MNDRETLLRIEGLNLQFHTPVGPVTALKDLSLSINRGEILALVGESGSGKSVTAMTVMGLLPRRVSHIGSGKIRLHQKDGTSLDLLSCSAKAQTSIRGSRVSMIFQEPMTSLNPLMTCGEQVAEGLRTHLGLGRREAMGRAEALFDRVRLPDPGGMLHRYPHQLSGGQKQRVMIAMAMGCQPDLLIADEPTTALDVTVQRTILTLIRELQQESGMSVLFITHDLGVVSEIADRVAVMYRGEIVESGMTTDILASPQHIYTRALLACRPSLHQPGTRLPVVAEIMSAEHMTPHTAIQKNPPILPMVEPRHQTDDSVLLRVKSLRVQYPGRAGTGPTYAVDGVDFEIMNGEFLGLVGESGCGKTTLGRTLLGLANAAEGSILHENKDLLRLSGSEWRVLRRSFQLIFQDPFGSLNPRMRIGDAIAEPMKIHDSHQTPMQRKERVAQLLEKVGLRRDHYNRYPHEFSGGQRQRVGIARALALSPKFLILDESVSALDVSVQAQILNLLLDLRNEFRFTALFISHDLTVVRHICDRILVMRKGRIIESGTAEQIYQDPRAEYTRELIESIPGRSDVQGGREIKEL
jgi:peptide/nickel transport system ATP-binding protein